MKTLTKIFLSCVLLACLCTNASAGVITFHQRIEAGLVGGCTPIIAGSVLCDFATVTVLPATGDFSDRGLKDILTLGIDHSFMQWYPDSFDCRVGVSIQEWDKHGNALPTLADSLRVRYTPFTYTPYIDKSAFVFKNAYKYTVTITGVKITGIGGGSPYLQNQLPLNVYLDADIDLQRYNDFIPLASTPISTSTIDSDYDCDGVKDELFVTWPAQTGAEQYDLEWTFVNDYNYGFNTYIPSTDLGYNFRFNSTRITTTNTNYGISLIYEHGYLVYRVRGVGRDTNNTNINIIGVWSIPDSGKVSSASNYHITVPHQLDSMDYQYNATFAEEGKKKEVVTYYDGSLRSREAVTKMNSDKNVLVGQTIYDYQGRPAVTVLPVPVQFPTCSSPDKQPSIHYFPDFNLHDSLVGSTPHTRPYSRLDFDRDTVQRCSVTADSMSVFNGASNYYSPSNPNQLGYQAYVPDAHGYPFSQVQYTPDNTGRIRAQGGVGQQFQLGSNHQTQYYYGQPFQLEMDRMFGSEMGDASHYKKNVVIDPNGQASISYLDQEGRTIATCLAALPGKDSTGNYILNPLPSEINASQQLRVDMFAADANGHSNNNQVNIEGTAIVFNTQVAVSSTSTYAFKYFVSVDSLEFLCSLVCYSCAYDLDIRVTDDCGNIVAPLAGSTNPITKLIGNFTMVGGNVVFNTNCSNPPIDSNTQEFSLILPPGNYTVSKVLTVDTAALHYYEDQYLDSANGCAKTLYDFQKAFIANADTCNCHISCSTCIASLGSRDDFVSKGKGTAEQYDFLYEQCQLPCKSKSLCDVQYQQMISDVSPGGQYGQYLTSLAQVYPNAFPLSVFNDTNELPININTGTGNWQFPKTILNGNTYTYYINSDGSQSFINLDSTLTGFIPQVAVNNPTLIKRNPSTLKYYTVPSNLKNFSDFIGYWQISWAQSLVTYHPEYCYYQVCESFEVVQKGDTISSEGFDELMQKTKHFSDAITAGFINVSKLPTTDTTGRVYDFFVSGAGHLYDPFTTNAVFQAMSGFNINATFASVFTRYQRESPTSMLSMVEAAAQAARCGTNYGSNFPANCTDFGNPYFLPEASFVADDDSINDREWNNFKNFYLSEKEHLQKNIQDYYGLYQCGEYNGCIGQAGFNPWADGMFVPPVRPFLVKSQPCGYKTWGFYANKQRRFVDGNDIPNQSQSAADYQMYLLTGQCPLAFEEQNFLAALASSGNLTHTGVVLTGYPQFTLDMYNAITPAPPIIGITYNWDATVAGNTLTANFTDPSTSIVHCTLTLDLTGSGLSSFSNISSFQDLQYTGTSGGMDQYTITAVVNDPTDTSHPFTFYTIHGSSCLNIHGCKFQQQCSPNQLATDLQNMMSALAANGTLTGTAINLEVSPYNTMITPSILNTLGLPHSNLRWSYISPNEFDLYDNLNPNMRIKLNFTSYSPNTFTPSSLSTIKMFDSANSDYQNQFTINGLDASMNKLVFINGNASLDSMNITRGLSMGNCGLPTPAECQGAPYQNVSQLSSILNGVLTQRPFKTDINITTNPYFTPQISSYFPAILDSTASNDDSTIVGTKFTETLTFKLYVSDTAGGKAHLDSAKSCPFYLTHTDNTNNLHFNFTHLIGIENFTATGNLSNGTLQSFYFVAMYSAVSNPSPTNVVITDTVRGYSCIPLLNCNACASNEPSAYNQSPTQGGLPGMGAPISVDQGTVTKRDSTLLATHVVMPDSNLSNYNAYVTAQTNLNTAMGWTPSDSNYLQPEPYTTFALMQDVYTTRAYLNYAKYYDSTLDNARYLRSLLSFTINNGNRINARAAYHRYSKAIGQYNARAVSVSGAIMLTPLGDSLFYTLGMADSISLYLAYLKAYPTIGNNPTSDTAFLRAHNSLAPAGDPCVAAYINYLNAYLQFERHQLADSIRCPDYPQISPLYTYNDFVTNGLCSSMDTGYNKITAYVARILDTTQCPGPLPNLMKPLTARVFTAADDVNYEDCKSLYAMWQMDVDAFNQSAYAMAHGYSLPGYQSISPDQWNANFCACASAYLQYLLPYISLSPMSSMPAPVPITMFGPCGYVPPYKDTTCDSAYSKYITAVETYNAFVLAHSPPMGPDTLPLITQIYPDSDFTASGYCYCVSSYIAFLNSVEHGTVTAPPYQMIQTLGTVQLSATGFAQAPAGGGEVSQNSVIQAYLDIGTNCQAQEAPPCVGSPLVDTARTLTVNPGNPCVKQLLANAEANGQNAYNNYRDSLLTLFRTRYMSHCLNAAESLLVSYTDEQFHYTLYYYDQAGNLIRTSPPQGTQLVGQGQPIFTFTDPKEQNIIRDRTYDQHTFFTNDVLTSTYLYNSLNQLTKQAVPDDDNMNIWQFTLPNGLDSRLVTTGTQFVDASRGFLSGYIPAGTYPKRGYLYTTNNGGSTWTRLNGLVGANINKVVMISATNGYAVGDGGILLSTIDAGTSWDIIPLYNNSSNSYTTSLNDIAYDGGNYCMIVGAAGQAFVLNTTGNVITPSTGISPTDSLTGVAFDPTGMFVACGDSSGYGVIYHTAVSPYTANAKVSSLYTQSMYSVQFLRSSPSIGFAGGLNGILLSTSDKGKHWFAKPTNLRNHTLREVYFVTQNNGVALIDSIPGSYKQIYLTSNGGLTWTLLSKKGAYYNDMNFYYDPTSLTYKGIACGQNGVITRILSTPGNVSPYFALVSLNAPSSYTLNSAAAVYTGTSTISIMAAGQSNFIYYVNKYNTGSPTVTWDSIGFPSRYKKVALMLNKHGNMLPALISGTNALYRLVNNNANPPMFTGVDSATAHYVDLVNTGPDSMYTYNYTNQRLYVLDSNTNVPSTELTITALTNSVGTGDHISAFDFAGAQNFAGTDSSGTSGILYTARVNVLATTWTNVSANTHSLRLYDIREDNPSPFVLAVGDYGTTLYSTSSAGPFYVMNDSTNKRLYSLSPRNLTTGLMAGAGGALYQYIKGVNYNLSITPIAVPVTANLYDIGMQSASITAYIAGANGTELYVTNAFSINPTVQLGISAGTGDLRGIAEIPSSSAAIAVGTGAGVFKYAGGNGYQVNDVFTPGLYGENFMDALHGYAVGAFGTVRRTDNGGNTWQLVLPEINATGTPDLATVWTTSPGNAILGGTQNFLGQAFPDNTVLSAVTYAYGSGSNTWYKARFSSYFPNTGFIVGGGGNVLQLNIVGGALNTTSALLATPPSTADLHSLHVFRDNSFMAVGASGVIYYYTPVESPYWFTETPTGLSGYASFTWNDIDARDDITMWVVGDSAVNAAGEIIRAIAPYQIQPPPPYTSPPPTLAWQREPVVDGLSAHSIVSAATQVNYNAIAFRGPYDGFVGGVYAPSYLSTGSASGYPYARLLNDQGGQFSELLYYDRVGRVVVSQNTKQRNYTPQAYNYTLYDVLGRAIESGQKTENTDTANNFNKIFGDTVMGFMNPNVISNSKFFAWIKDNTGLRKEVVHTYYDLQDISPTNVLQQQELRNRVASITYRDTILSNDSTQYNSATHYSYDVHGNVATLVQDNPKNGISNQRYKRLDYQYDLISNNVNEVDYQNDSIDQYHHKYMYDADNRITQVQTSKDSVMWDNDANYFYYAHGPIARLELGDQQVQGMDFAYTLQEWFKGVNSDQLDGSHDMGHDAQQVAGNLNRYFARDAIGYTLKYFDKSSQYYGDYDAISPTAWSNVANRFEAYTYGSDLTNSRRDLFNGNITAMSTTITQPQLYSKTNSSQTAITLPQGTAYKYDQLERIMDMKAYQNLDASSNTWLAGSTYAGLYHDSLTYDENGNIISQQRNDSVGGIMSTLMYQYNIQGGRTLQNRLYHINNTAATPNPKDIQDEGIFNSNATTIDQTNNYEYNSSGQLAKDKLNQIDTIIWTIGGKIKSIKRITGSSLHNLVFDYDAMQNKLAKHVYSSSGTWLYDEYYVRDAKGNIITVYRKETISSNLSYSLIERDIYGKGRIGTENTRIEMIGAIPSSSIDTFSRYLGLKYYEMDNFLHNVLSIVSDRKIPRPDGSGLNIDHFEADVISSQDYYPFGMIMPGRNFSILTYRFSFNAKEKVDEIYGIADAYDYGDRMFDPRIGRFLSEDPLFRKYPYYTPYQFAGNNPVRYVDLDGREKDDPQVPEAKEVSNTRGDVEESRSGASQSENPFGQTSPNGMTQAPAGTGGSFTQTVVSIEYEGGKAAVPDIIQKDVLVYTPPVVHVQETTRTVQYAYNKDKSELYVQTVTTTTDVTLGFDDKTQTYTKFEVKNNTTQSVTTTQEVYKVEKNYVQRAFLLFYANYDVLAPSPELLQTNTTKTKPNSIHLSNEMVNDVNSHLQKNELDKVNRDGAMDRAMDEGDRNRDNVDTQDSKDVPEGDEK